MQQRLLFLSFVFCNWWGQRYIWRNVFLKYFVWDWWAGNKELWWKPSQDRLKVILQRGWSARMGTRLSSHRPACSIRYQSPHVSSSVKDSVKTFTGAHSCRPHQSHFSHGRENRRSSFSSGIGDNLVTIARFGKPLFANNKHHRVCAVAGALWKPNVACPHPDVSTGTGWPVWWWCDRRWVRTKPMPASVLIFRPPNGFFFGIALFAKDGAIGLKSVESRGGNLHSQQRAANGAPSEIVKESSSLLRERALGAWRWTFKVWDQLSSLQQHQHNQPLPDVKFLVR